MIPPTRPPWTRPRRPSAAPGRLWTWHLARPAEARGVFVGMLALLTASLAAGWLLGGPGSDNRKTMALTTSLRNVGVCLVIATGGICAGAPAGPAVIVY